MTGGGDSPSAANGVGVSGTIRLPNRLVASEFPTGKAGNPFRCTGKSDGEEAVAENGEDIGVAFSGGATTDVIESPVVATSEWLGSTLGG